MRTRHAEVIRSLTFDPGFSNLGWAVSERLGRDVAPLALGMIRTEREEGCRSRDDEERRVEELAAAVRLLRERWAPAEIGTEDFSPVRSAVVTARMAMVWTVLKCEALYAGLPFRRIAPMALKVAVAGKRSASKAEVQAALAARYGGERLHALAQTSGVVKRAELEHPMDALAVATALASL